MPSSCITSANNWGLPFNCKTTIWTPLAMRQLLANALAEILRKTKKPFWYISRLLTELEQQQELTRWFSNTPKDDSAKITAVTELFSAAKADTATLEEVARYTKNAFDVLDKIPLKTAQMQRFKDFGNWLMKRTQ
jgi:hypothetical protein